MHRRQRTEAGVDEVEASAPELAGQYLRVSLHPQDGGPALARRLERVAGDVDSGDNTAELAELRRRLTRPALQMQHPLVGEIRECMANGRRQSALACERFCAPAVDLVPGATVVLGRLHQARSE